MTTDWNPEQYLKFEKERTQPSIDLVARIRLTALPRRIIDIGCGPGNSTMVLRNRWPNAEIVGLDSSPAMLEKAKSIQADIRWIHRDADDDLSDLGRFDIVFSNAAIHHMPDKPRILGRLFGLLNSGGVLAVQVPDTRELAFAVGLQRLVASEKWNKHFQANDYPKKFHGYSFYYGVLRELTADIEIWQTDYIQILPGLPGIVEWYKGSGMRDYLAKLPADADRRELIADYEAALDELYPREKDGSVLLSMRRLFFIARKS